MSSFQIKVLAIVAMFIGHIGLFFFESPLWMYIIGRLAFPLFAFLLANGARHTKNPRAYLLRLFIFALISQIPFILANRIVDPNYWTLNILFTLFLGLLAILLTKGKSIVIKSIILTLFFIGGFVFQVDYGGLGVLSVVLFYYFDGLRLKTIISQTVIFVLINLVLLVSFATDYPNTSINPFYFFPYALFALIPIFLYSKKEGLKMKYLFYIIYPLQYLLFLFLHYL